MGSVKDLQILEPAYENRPGVGNFDFSDRYSAFDWSEMPNQIRNKGSALAVMSAFNFEELERRGVPTHYRGLVTSEGKLINFSDLEEGSNGANVMQVELGVVYHPTARISLNKGKPEATYDYSFFEANRGELTNVLTPLEIIFRNGLPKGSSVFRKIAKAKKIEDPSKQEEALLKIYQKLGLDSEPQPGDMLPKPTIGYTTKLEAGDRPLTEEEAFYVSGLLEEEFRELGSLALKVNEQITEQSEKTGFAHYDGKVEMIGLKLADVLGTFDENRFGFNGKQISKEVLRQAYIKDQPELAEACDEWKKTGEGWQERCPIKPQTLSPELLTLVSDMYMAGCNQYTGKKIFNVPELEEVVERMGQHK